MNYLKCKRWKWQKVKKMLPKDEIFEIQKYQSPLSIAQRVSFEMLNNFYP